MIASQGSKPAIGQSAMVFIARSEETVWVTPHKLQLCGANKRRSHDSSGLIGPGK